MVSSPPHSSSVDVLDTFSQGVGRFVVTNMASGNPRTATKYWYARLLWRGNVSWVLYSNFRSSKLTNSYSSLITDCGMSKQSSMIVVLYQEQTYLPLFLPPPPNRASTGSGSESLKSQ